MTSPRSPLLLRPIRPMLPERQHGVVNQIRRVGENFAGHVLTLQRQTRALQVLHPMGGSIRTVPKV